jgi:hypothetical protein
MVRYPKRGIGAAERQAVASSIRATVAQFMDNVRRLCQIEGFWGHKAHADLRVRRYAGITS